MAAAQWEKNFALLRAFVEREGHANVPKSHEEDGERLGQWLGTQRLRWQRRGMSEEERTAKKVSALSDEEVARLEAVGVVWDMAAAQWEQNYALLRAFVEREGHANVPKSHEEDGERLGEWLSKQRQRWQARGWSEEERKAKRLGTPLSDEKVARLEAVGVAWDVYAAQWEKNLALLRAFVAREGHANVPQRHEEDGERLGVWLSRQRLQWQARGWSEEERKAKRLSALSDEEVARLEAVGVAWDVYAAQWEKNYALLRAFVEREGQPTCRKSTRRTESG